MATVGFEFGSDAVDVGEFAGAVDAGGAEGLAV
jgi:hypothetical protein